MCASPGVANEHGGKATQLAELAQTRALATELGRALRAGRLTMGQAIGLSPRELAALENEARRLRRAGRRRSALAVYGLLLSCDPFEERHWRALAALLSRAGDEPAAATCREVADLLTISNTSAATAAGANGSSPRAAGR